MYVYTCQMTRFMIINVKALKLLNPYIILLVVTLLSLIPSSTLPEKETINIPNLDKIIHFIMYLTLSFSILLNYFYKNTKISTLTFVLIALFISIYGIIIEIIQEIFIYGRSGNIYDVLANISGCLLAIFIFNLLKIKLN